jgi:recombination protein U
MKSGKRLEANIKSSADYQSIFNYRLRDNAGAFSQGNLRFTSSNMCDFMLFYNGILLCLEAKNHKGKSLPLSCIRDNQYKQLINASIHYGVVCGILVYFEDLQQAYFLDIRRIEQFKRQEKRQSIPVDYFKQYGVSVKITQKKVNYTLDIKHLFENIEVI